MTMVPNHAKGHKSCSTGQLMLNSSSKKETYIFSGIGKTFTWDNLHTCTTQKKWRQKSAVFSDWCQLPKRERELAS